MHARVSAALLLTLTLAVSGLATAQETTGTITGRIVDAQGLAIPGATVTITGPQGARTFITDAEGQFRAPFLTPGVYTVRGELQGFKAVEQRNVNVSLGQTANVPLRMDVGGLTETVEVTATSPVINTQTTTVGATLSSEMLARVPVGRRMSDALYLAPGVSNSGNTGAMGSGRSNPSIGGGSGLENQYVVDGVNITNPGYGALGSYSIVFGSLGNGVTFDFIKEIQVKSAGYEAEYGQSTGGVVNVVTKSGTNNLRGTLFGYTRPSALDGDYTPVQSVDFGRVESVNTTQTSNSDVGFEVGFPVVRDRVFLFGAFDPQWETATFIAPEGAPLRSLGEVDRERRIYSYSAKGTFQMSSSHRVDASFFGDPADGLMGPQRRAALLRDDTAGYSEIAYGGHNQIVKFDGVLASNWLLEASFARAKNTIEETPSVNEWNVRDTTVTPQQRSGGIGFYEVGNDGKNMQYQLKSTNIVRGHQLRYGVLYEDIAYNNIIQRTGPMFTLPDGTQTTTGAEITILPDPTFGRIYRVVRANTGNIRETNQKYFNFFVQDTWQVNDRLTVRPGLRYEQQELVGNLAEFTWENNWAPRIGVTYDVLGNGRSKLYGNWGRFYAKIPNDLAARALSADAGVTRVDFFDAGLTRPVPRGTLAAGQTDHFIQAGLHPADFDPDAKSTYLDETLVGFEWEAFPNTSLGVRYIHRDFGRILEDIGTAPIAAYLLDLPGLESVEYFITNVNADTPVSFPQFGASFEDVIHDYDAVEFTVDRRFSNNWGVQASYRWSRLHGNFEGFYRNDNGQSDPGITSLFDFPTNDPSYASIAVAQFAARGDIRYLGTAGAGPLPNDRPHQGKVYGNYAFANGLNLGLGLSLGSGRPLTALAANPVYDSSGEVPETPRGDGFRTVDGVKKRAPMDSEVSFHADYGVNLGTRRLVVLGDVFNLFNRQGVLEYDDWTEAGFQVPNPDFGKVLVYQTPLQVRFGVRFEF
jgi:hypothetical protein